MAIIGIGVDMENILRFKNAEEKLLKRVFTDEELAFCFKSVKPWEHLAVRFCAKEAAFKALPFKEIAFKNIEVKTSQDGKPNLVIYDERANGLDIKLSLSHTDTAAIAFVVVSE